MVGPRAHERAVTSAGIGPPAVIVKGTARGNVLEGLDPHRPDDGGQAEGRLEHREVVADAGARPRTEREVLPTVAAVGVLREEPSGSNRCGSGQRAGSVCSAMMPTMTLLPAGTRQPSTMTSRMASRATTAAGGTGATTRG